MFRVAPIQYVAKVPGGKVYEDLTELVDSAATLATGFFENLSAQPKTLQDLDFKSQTPKIPSSTPQKMKTRAKKGKATLKCSPERRASTETLVIADSSKTPPFVEKLASRTASKVLQSLSKSNSVALQKEQSKSAKLAAENKALKEALAQAKAEIIALKKHVKELQNSLTHQSTNINAPKKGSKIYKPLIAEAVTFSEEPSPEIYIPKVKHSGAKRYPHGDFFSAKRRRSPSPQFVVRSATGRHSHYRSPSSSPSPEYIQVKPRSSPRFQKQKGDAYGASTFVHRYKVYK